MPSSSESSCSFCRGFLPTGLGLIQIDEEETMAKVGHGDGEVEVEAAMIHEVLLHLMTLTLGIVISLRPRIPHRDRVSGQGP